MSYLMLVIEWPTCTGMVRLSICRQQMSKWAIWISEHDEEPYLPQVLNNNTLLLSNWDAINDELLGIIDQTADLRSGSDKAQLTKLYKKIKGLLYDL
jgi:hypothetical protein